MAFTVGRLDDVCVFGGFDMFVLADSEKDD